MQLAYWELNLSFSSFPLLVYTLGVKGISFGKCSEDFFFFIL